MNISAEEAASLLRKWQDERRKIQAVLLVSDQVNSCTLGRIEHVSPELFVKINGSSMFRAGRLISLSLDLSRALEIRFEDWRDAPPQLTEPLRENYDAFIFADFGHYRCELYAMKTNDELPLP